MTRDVLERIILENQAHIKNIELIQRDFEILDTEHITVLTGIRRSGKTHILYSIAQKYPHEDILFLDLEDERLLGLNTLSNYDIIIDSYHSIFPNKKPVLFFDEIQNLDNWHLYMKRLHVQGYKIYITGSNANLISREIATYLKGRSLETTIFPFSFEEFLLLKNIVFSKSEWVTKNAQLLFYFEEFMQFGGFPEVIKVLPEHKRTVAQNLYNLLFYKDVVNKYDKNDYLLKLIVNKIAENITKEYAISNLARKIIPMYQASIPTIIDYFNILPEPYLTSNIYQYRTSFVVRQSKRKTYLTDNSFIFLNRITTDKSRLFENMVFNFLQRKYKEIYYYKTNNSLEVDFYVNGFDRQILIQVSISIQDLETKEREIKSLTKAMEELNIAQGYIYTYNENEIVEVKAGTIQVIPFWKVSLEH
jgi:predicted AAA+ superfamily ATPase